MNPMSQPPRTMGAIETAVIVFRYLEGQHFSKTLKAFKREAKETLAKAPQVPRGLKPLAVMLGEYVALREADERRAHLFAKNPALRDMFQIIETQSAALQPSYAGQFTGAAAPGEPRNWGRTLSGAGGQVQSTATEAQSHEQEDYYTGAPAAGDLNGDFSTLQGVQNHTPVMGNYSEAQQAAGNAPGASPRKTTRKRAPKRKMPGGCDAHAQLDTLGDGFGASIMDLLNQPINERALETLLAGDWQGRFAEGLASCINDRLAPQQQQEQLEQLAAQSAAAALPAYDEVEMNTWMASLTGDPGMAALLEPIVAPHQGMDGYDEGGGANQDMPDDMQLDEPHDNSPSEQHSLPEPSPVHVQIAPQHGAACSSQELDQAETPTTPVDPLHGAKPAVRPGGPPQVPILASAAAAGAAPQAPNLAAAEQAPVQASAGDARTPAAAQKARRRLSLEPLAFPPATAAAPPERQPVAARPLLKETGAASAAHDMMTAQPTQGVLFAEAASGPNTSPDQQEISKDDSRTGDRRGTTAEASFATPKLSVLLSDPMSTLDGFSAHVLAAKARTAVPSAAAKPAADASRTPGTDAQMQAAGAQQGAGGKGAPHVPLSHKKGRSGTAASVVSVSDVQSSGAGFFGDPVSTLDGFQGDVLAASARAVPATAVAAQPSAGGKPAAEILAARQGTHAQAQPSAARSRAAQKPGAQQRRGRKAGVTRGVPAARAAATTHGAGIFGDPINTLDGFSGDILSARAAAASAARPQANAALSTSPNIGSVSVSFLDAMPTLDGFPADDGDAAAARPPAQAGEGSRQLPGSRTGAAAAAAMPQALSPIPLRIGPDGWLSSGPAISRNVGLSAGTLPAGWQGTGGAAAGRAALPDQARQGREDVHSGQERGIWRSEESMDAVLNQDAFRDPSPAPEQAAAAAAQRPRQAAASGSAAAAIEAPATDFSGLQARIGSITKGSSCAQQQGGGNARALSSVFAGGASAESLDAFMRSLKY